MSNSLRHIVCVSDMHAGSSVALCPPDFELDDGGLYRFSDYQGTLWSWWREFWDEWVPRITGKERYAVVINGDVIDGQVKQSTTNWSVNFEDQARAAIDLLKPVAAEAAEFYIVRGTEAHVGKSAQFEERIARELQAIGHGKTHSRWDLWYRLGDRTIHFAHHIGTTSSTAYEASALCRELVAAFVEAGQWQDQPPPSMCVRSHRHRFCLVSIPTVSGEATIFVTPGWQLHTPFSHRMGQSMRVPQIGGVCISLDGGELVVRKKIWAPKVRNYVSQPATKSTG